MNKQRHTSFAGLARRSLLDGAAVALGGFALPALAQVPPGTVPLPAPGSSVAPLIVTASRVGQEIADAIPHTTILVERDIRESQALDLLSLLRREAGFEFVQSGGIGTLTGIFLRGSEARQTLVLVDGQRIESATSGAPALEQIMLDEVERIEIVRGNVSSLYGSGAVGGVIQIFTKRGAGPLRGELQAGGGSRGTLRASGTVRGEVGGTRVALTASGLRTDGFSAIDAGRVPGANPDRDGYRNLSVSGQVSHRLGDRFEVGARFYRSASDVDFDNAFGMSPAESNTADNAIASFSGYFKAKIADRWQTSLTIGRGSDRNENFTDGAFDSLFETRNKTITWANEFSVATGHTVTAGLERLEQRVTSSTPYTGTARDVDSGWLGYVGRLGPHHLQLNARLDHYSDFGSQESWLAGYGFELTPEWKATAMVSTAFNAPTFNFLYFPDFGNPDLKPERSRSVEVGGQYAKNGTIARLVWFLTDYRDLIQNVAPTFLPRNVADAQVDGVEASFAGSLAGIEWRASATLQDPQDETNDRRLLRRARKHGSIAAARSFGDWRIGAEVIASGPRVDISPTTFSRVELPGYAVVNLTARWQIARAWWAGLRVDNVLDRDYELVSGYNTPRRGAFVTVGWQP